MPFPLFRLPSVAITEVFKNMSHETLFLLSISTRKGKSYIKTYLPKQSKTADIHLCHMARIIPDNGLGHFRIIGLNSLNWPKKAIRCTIGNDLAAVHLALGQIDFYWTHSDFKNAFSNVIKHMCDCWNCPKVSITQNGFYGLEDFSYLIEELKRNNLKIESIYFLKNDFYVDKLVKFLTKCAGITSKLIVDSEIDDFFETRHSRDFIRVKEFEIKNCRWAFLEDFMECRSIKVECVIGHGHWTQPIEQNFGDYINTFIKKWLSDHECQLEIVTITNCPFAFEQITHGLSRGRISHDVLKLQRKDGKHILITLTEKILKIELI